MWDGITADLPVSHGTQDIALSCINPDLINMGSTTASCEDGILFPSDPQNPPVCVGKFYNLVNT